MYKNFAAFLTIYMLMFIITGCHMDDTAQTSETTQITVTIPDDYSNILTRP